MVLELKTSTPSNGVQIWRNGIDKEDILLAEECGILTPRILVNSSEYDNDEQSFINEMSDESQEYDDFDMSDVISAMRDRYEGNVDEMD